MSEHDLLKAEGVRIGICGAALLMVTATSVVVGLPTNGSIIVLGTVTGVCAISVGPPGALLLGVTGWALCTGFGVNQLGELTFATSDWLRLLAYVGCALILGGVRAPAQ